MSDAFIRPLDSLRATDIPLAGGKGANLGELVRGGFRVPPGFVVTTSAYAAMAGRAGLGRLVEKAVGEGMSTGDSSGQLRAAVQGTGVPDDVREAVAHAYDDLGGGPVAVRSSATAEDLEGAAFAGQQDTFLNVVGLDAVLDALVGCWASLWTDRAVAYRERAGVDQAGVSIAVVVQRLVPAATAGVLFTADPVTGERGHVVVDAAAGLGEAVVSGMVTPEHWVLAAGGKVLEHLSGGGEAVVRPALPGGTVVEHPPSGAEDAPPLLMPAQLAELASLARSAEEYFGRPQDIEWAIAENVVWLVQSRPLTGLPPQPPHLNRIQRKFTGPLFLEMFQTRPYPLDVTGWLRPGIFEMLRRMTGSIGVVFPDESELLPQEDGVVVQLVPPLPRPTMRILTAPASVLARARRHDARHWTEDPRLDAFLAEIRRLNAIVLDDLVWSEVTGAAEDALAALAIVADLRVSYLPSAFLPQVPLRLSLMLLGRRNLGPALVAGAPTLTNAANKALEALARQATSDPELSRALVDEPPLSVLHRVRTEDRFTVFRAELEAFLAEYGHRETVSVAIASAPAWRDAPETVLGIVRTLLSKGPTEATDRTADALAEVCGHPFVRAITPLRRMLTDTVERARAGLAFREDTHFYATMVLPPLRRAFVDLGRRLTHGGVLDTPDDVWHLTYAELAAVTDEDGALPAWVRDTYRPLVQARKEERRRLEPFPLLDPQLLLEDRPATEGALVFGTAASRGRVSGPVRVIHGPNEFGQLAAGEILVCPYTNPSWTPLFQRAAAVVVDTGGPGSHAAIVAREYGIPAVMGTGRGTSVLSNGQHVLVDGSAGAVFRGETA